MPEKQTAGRELLGEFAPKFAELDDDVLFGEVWAREKELSPRDRSIITVSSLIANGNFEQLTPHLQKAKKNGVTKDEKPLNTSIGNVTFAPGSRNNWHSHKVGQVLLVTGGEGWYQEEGKAAQLIKKGDVVNIPPNVKHWHGATKDSWFVHLAMTPGETEWLEPVDDEWFNKL